MKLKDVKDKIDNYFSKITADKLFVDMKKYDFIKNDKSDYLIQYSSLRISYYIMINGYIMDVSFWKDDMQYNTIMDKKIDKAIDLYELHLKNGTLNNSWGHLHT